MLLLADNAVGSPQQREQTAGSSPRTPWTPHKRRHVQKLNTRVHRLRKKLDQQKETPDVPKSRTRDQLIKDLSQFLSGPTLDFVVSQVRVANVKNKGQRWSPKDKALALSLLHSSPTDLFDCAQCASRSMIVNLFVYIRLHHSLKEANRDFCSRGRKNRKVLKCNHA